MEIVQISVVLGGEGWIGREQKIFRTVKYSMWYYNYGYIYIYIYTFVQTIGCWRPKVNPKVNYQLRAIEVGQCRVISSVAQSCPNVCNPMDCSTPPCAAWLPCPSPTPRVYLNSCPLSWWCHPAISSSVIPFSSRLRSFSASGSFQMSQPFTLGGQSIGVSASASVLSMNI